MLTVKGMTKFFDSGNWLIYRLCHINHQENFPLNRFNSCNNIMFHRDICLLMNMWHMKCQHTHDNYNDKKLNIIWPAGYILLWLPSLNWVGLVRNIGLDLLSCESHVKLVYPSLFSYIESLFSSVQFVWEHYGSQYSCSTWLHIMQYPQPQTSPHKAGRTFPGTN